MINYIAKTADIPKRKFWYKTHKEKNSESIMTCQHAFQPKRRLRQAPRSLLEKHIYASHSQKRIEKPLINKMWVQRAHRKKILPQLNSLEIISMPRVVKEKNLHNCTATQIAIAKREVEYSYACKSSLKLSLTSQQRLVGWKQIPIEKNKKQNRVFFLLNLKCLHKIKG